MSSRSWSKSSSTVSRGGVGDSPPPATPPAARLSSILSAHSQRRADENNDQGDWNAVVAGVEAVSGVKIPSVRLVRHPGVVVELLPPVLDPLLVGLPLFVCSLSLPIDHISACLAFLNITSKRRARRNTDQFGGKSWSWTRSRFAWCTAVGYICAGNYCCLMSYLAFVFCHNTMSKDKNHGCEMRVCTRLETLVPSANEEQV